MNRSVDEEEFQAVYTHATDLGFLHLFVQLPENGPGKNTGKPPFLPDFKLEQPFSCAPGQD
jgi:hypothetical protein